MENQNQNQNPVSSLTQINVSFNPVEDRLLMRMTSGAGEGIAEYRMWLTRRFVRLLWQALDKVLEADTVRDPKVDPGGRGVVRQFQEEDALSRADFATPYSPPKTVSTPLGEEPVLLSRLNLREAADGNRILTLQNQGGQGVSLGISLSMIHSVRKLLADAVEKAGWDLNLLLYSRTVLSAEHMPHTVQ
jgi:hypothetical protein